MIVGALLLTVIIVFLHFADLSLPDGEIQDRFKHTGFTPEKKSVTFNDSEFNYITVGAPSNPAVLFVHGSPGSWDNFIDVMTDTTLLNSFRLIAYNRPGYGENNPGKPERTLKTQADIAAEILKNENVHAIITGHSYGGPVAVRLAIDHPEVVDALVLVAASVDPELEEMYWVQYLFDYQILSWILPDFLYVSNEEVLALESELRKMEDHWSQISKPTSIIQGKQDRLVPWQNATYAEQKLMNAKVDTIMIEDADHFIPWSNPGVINKELFRLQQHLESSINK